MICGGTKPGEMEATTKVQAICDTLKDVVQGQASVAGWSGEITSIKALTYTSQVVAGTNYFVKAKINDTDFFQLRIFEPLPHTQQPAKLHSIDLTKGDAPP